MSMSLLPSLLTVDYWTEMYIARPWVTLLIAGSTAIVASDFLYYVYTSILRRRRPGKEARNKALRILTQEEEKKRQLSIRKPPKHWNTVVLFPGVDPDGPKSSMQQLLGYFRSAKISIQLCVYLTSHPALVQLIREKFEEGLLVQVVTDYDTFTAHNNFGPKLWKKDGIEVRMKATGFLMHHKFAIIDEEAVLTGSLNWTKQGLANNQENVLVTTNPPIVQQYLKEFYELWSLFDSENNDA